MQQSTDQKANLRKAMLFAPCVVVPLVLVMAYALGIGKGTSKPQQVQQGINTAVPEPKLSENPLDKMALYRKADKDAAQREKLLRADPLYDQQQQTETADEQVPQWMEQYGKSRSLQSRVGEPDATEKRLREQLSRLEAQLTRSTHTDIPPISPSTTAATVAGDAELTALQNQIKEASTLSTDSEITAINEMLKNVLDVQHPQRVRERLRSEAPEKTIYPVFTSGGKKWSSFLSAGEQTGDTLLKQGGFHDLHAFEKQVGFMPNAIRAAIYGTQTVVSGATVILQLTQDVFVRGQRVLKGTLLSGKGSLSGDRFTMEVSLITIDQLVIPVKLTVYDLQGMPGIFITGGISREIASKEATSTLQSMQLMNVDPSLESQAISAGIETAKGLFTRKVKLVKSTLKDGHPVLLVDASSL